MTALSSLLGHGGFALGNADQFVTDLAEGLAKQKDLSLITKEMGPDINLLGLAAGKPVGKWSGLPSGVFVTFETTGG